MVYRHTAAQPNHVESEIRSLAAIGRMRRDAEREEARRREARAARKKAREQLAVRRARERAARMRRRSSVVPLSWMTRWWIAAYVGFNLLALSPLAFALGGAAVGWVLVGLGVVAMVAPLPLRLLARRRLARERAWIEAQRFPVRGHWAALGSAETTRTVSVSFRGAPPAAELVADLIAATGAEASEVEVEGRAVSMKVRGATTAMESTRGYRRRFRVLLEEVIARLDDVYGVVGVGVRTG